MPSSSGFNRLNNLPGQQRPGAQMPTDAIQSFQNQKLPGLSTGTSRTTQPEGSPAEQLLSMRRPETGVSLSAKRTNEAVRATNRRLLTSAQLLGQKRRAQAAQPQPGGGGQGQYRGRQGGSGHFPGDGHNHGGGGGGGLAVTRVEGILRNFPGLRITETHGDREYDRAHGVARSPNSYHYDRENPAVDIAGSPAQLHRLYSQLVAMGGWRQILWQVPGHYDHIHVA